MIPYINRHGVEVLQDMEFQASLTEIEPFMLLDSVRLANLWQLSRMTNPLGVILEVGAYKGGTAMHLSNACPGRQVIACEAFNGPRALEPDDGHIEDWQFRDVAPEAILGLFRGHSIELLKGYFPECWNGRRDAISFVHLDVDTYQATFDSLCFLPSILASRSLVVVDDYGRSLLGARKAVDDFVRERKDWLAFPIFPGQALVLRPAKWA